MTSNDPFWNKHCKVNKKENIMKGNIKNQAIQ